MKLTLGLLTIFIFSACSSVHVADEPVVLPEVPEYVKTPHPSGFDLADLKAIFFHPLAPKELSAEFAQSCGEELEKLSEKTKVPQEKLEGAQTLIERDPERHHWCFYSKISALQDVLQGETSYKTRQEATLKTFEYLTPIANAFLKTYHDSRYFRWATQYYMRISEWVFYKKVVPTEENTLAMMSVAAGQTRQELEPWVPIQKSEKMNVFEKYGISLVPTIPIAETPITPIQPASPLPLEKSEQRQPASVDHSLDDLVLPEVEKVELPETGPAH